VIQFNFTMLTFSLAIGISTCGSATIGKLIGNGNISEAKIYKSLIYRLTMVIALMVAIGFQLGCRTFFKLFTSDPEIIDIGDHTSLVVAITLGIDFMLSCQSGIIRACGL
jgi:Na+-driven multidrug efflux pump